MKIKNYFAQIRAVHESVWVGFGLNSKLTRSSQVENDRTCNWPPINTGQVGLGLGRSLVDTSETD